MSSESKSAGILGSSPNTSCAGVCPPCLENLFLAATKQVANSSSSSRTEHLPEVISLLSFSLAHPPWRSALEFYQGCSGMMTC